MIINDYRFGQIVIDGEKYTSDVIILPERIVSWWRRTGHSVAAADLREVVAARPEMLVIGTGAYGAVRVPLGTEEFLVSQGIALIALPTAKACEKYNQLREKRRVVAALHLTC
ncbi:MAG: hypothetical protein IBX71_03550 [Candidatus Desulforudis sp.]|nr:hypothetical protein [Desulforudis sp.]